MCVQMWNCLIKYQIWLALSLYHVIFKNSPSDYLSAEKQLYEIFLFIRYILITGKETVTSNLLFFKFSYYLKGEQILTCKLSGDQVYWNYAVPTCESK